MKTLIVCETQGQGYGAERVLEYLLTGWVDLGLQEQNPIHILAPEGAVIHEYAQALHIPHTAFDGVSQKIFPNIMAARHFAKTSSLIQWADVVHAWTARAFELVIFLAKGNPTAVISGTLHDHPKAIFHGNIRQRIMKLSANRMHGLACVSTAVQDEVIKAGYKCPVSVCHNGIPNQKLLSSTTGSPKPVRIGFLGMYADWKGFNLVSQWIKATTDLHVIWNLYGEPTPKNLDLLKSMPQNVNRMGWTPMPEIWSHVDILVHASTEFDPFPTVLLEAARAGVPCLASNLGGAAEIIQNEISGYLFNPRKPEEGLKRLKKMILDENQKGDLGTAANQIYQKSFTAQDMGKRYASFWRNLMSSAVPDGISVPSASM